MIDLNSISYIDIQNLTLKEITEYFKHAYNSLPEAIEKYPEKLELIFYRLRKIFRDYHEFCTYIKDVIKPSFEFYVFATKRPVFFKRGAVPEIFFTNIEDEEYDITYVTGHYDEVVNNIFDMIDHLNRGKRPSEIEKINHEVETNIYTSFLYYLESGNGSNYIYDMNLSNPKLNFNPRELKAIDHIMEIEDSSSLSITFYKLDNNSNPVLQYSKKDCLEVAKNYSKIIGNSKEKLTKVILGVLKSNIECMDEVIKQLVTNYESQTGNKYEYIIYQNGHTDINATYNFIIDSYVKKLIDQEYTDDDIKYVMIELINAHFEAKDIDKFLPLIEAKLFDSKDEYLLLLYQTMLSEKYAMDNDLQIDYYYYNPFLNDFGGYDEGSNSIRFYLNDPQDMENPCVIYDAMETAFHEIRHAYQYQKLMHKMSYSAFLNDIERVITDRYDDSSDRSTYRERYEDIYYERDARIYSFYETFKRLKNFNHEDVKRYVRSRMDENLELDYGIKDWKDDAGKEFYKDRIKQRSEETFIFLITKLYELFSLEDIASMREEFDTFREVIHEDGTLYTKEELLNKLNSCIVYDKLGYPSDESMRIRGFIYELINMYSKCPEIEDVLQSSRH